jgi:transcriptional regulator with XRE-family HTH domain
VFKQINGGALMARLIIKEIAEKQGLNQSKLQIKAGVTIQLLNRYWNNNTESIALKQLQMIADALGVEPGELIVSDGKLPESHIERNLLPRDSDPPLGR